MKHLTLTGYYAGQTLCGASRTLTDDYYHAIYAPDVILDSPEMCPICKGLWLNDGVVLEPLSHEIQLELFG